MKRQCVAASIRHGARYMSGGAFWYRYATTAHLIYNPDCAITRCVGLNGGAAVRKSQLFVGAH